MNENNNIPQYLSADQLQEIYDQHRYDRRRYRYFDREGRLAWSNKEGYSHYTWYLHNDDGHIIEMGESYVNAGALGHVLTVYQCTTAEAGDYICKKAGRDNVLRLAIDQPQETIPQIFETTITPVVIIPAKAEGTVSQEALTHIPAITTSPVVINPAIADENLPTQATSPLSTMSLHHQTPGSATGTHTAICASTLLTAHSTQLRINHPSSQLSTKLTIHPYIHEVPRSSTSVYHAQPVSPRACQSAVSKINASPQLFNHCLSLMSGTIPSFLQDTS